MEELTFIEIREVPLAYADWPGEKIEYLFWNGKILWGLLFRRGVHGI